MEISSPQRTFSALELWYLSTFFAPGIIVGLEDPTLGLLTEEIQELSNQARGNLLKRGLLVIDPLQGLCVNPELASQLKILMNPRHSVVLAIQTAGHPTEVLSYHYGENDLLELHEVGKSRFTLSSIQRKDQIKELTISPFLLDIFFVDQLISFRMPEKTLLDIRQSFFQGKEAEGIGLAQRAGLNQEDIDQILPVFRSPRVSMSLVLFANRDNPKCTSTRGFAAVAGDMTLWMFEPDPRQAGIANISLISKSTLEEKIESLLPWRGDHETSCD